MISTSCVLPSLTQIHLKYCISKVQWSRCCPEKLFHDASPLATQPSLPCQVLASHCALRVKVFPCLSKCFVCLEMRNINKTNHMYIYIYIFMFYRLLFWIISVIYIYILICIVYIIIYQHTFERIMSLAASVMPLLSVMLFSKLRRLESCDSFQWHQHS